MTEGTDVLERWSEYIGELLEDDRVDKPAITEKPEEPPILVEEVEFVLKNMKKRKAPVLDNVTVEEIFASGKMGIIKLTKLLNAIYQNGIIPADLSRSVFVAILKRAGADECENNRTISFMSHVTKVLMRIILNRWTKKVGMEVSDVQCGFVKDKGTANAIFIIRNIIERSLEVQKRVYACFIDYTKAFDKVKHEELINMLRKLHIDSKDTRIIANLYWNKWLQEE